MWVAHSCPTFCDPGDCCLPGSSLYGISTRQEYWSGLPPTRFRDRTGVSCRSRRGSPDSFCLLLKQSSGIISFIDLQTATSQYVYSLLCATSGPYTSFYNCMCTSGKCSLACLCSQTVSSLKSGLSFLFLINASTVADSSAALDIMPVPRHQFFTASHSTYLVRSTYILPLTEYELV